MIERALAVRKNAIKGKPRKYGSNFFLLKKCFDGVARKFLAWKAYVAINFLLS